MIAFNARDSCFRVATLVRDEVQPGTRRDGLTGRLQTPPGVEQRWSG